MSNQIKWMLSFWMLFLTILSAYGADLDETQYSITEIKLIRKGSFPPDLEILPPTLPFLLEKPEDFTNPTWEKEFTFTTNVMPFLNILYGKIGKKTSNGQATLKLKFKKGKSIFLISTIGPLGELHEYELSIEVDKVTEAIQQAPKAFLVAGPFFAIRSISRKGSALTQNTSGSAPTVGARIIYRHRVLKWLTNHIPIPIKLFFDGTLAGGKTLGGDATVQGFPLWVDARGTLEVFSWNQLRIELGAGMTLFMPNLSQSVPGDLSNFFGFTASARFAYPILHNTLIFLGANIATPSSTSEKGVILTSQPLEFFIATSFALFKKYFLEVRFRYFSIGTNGAAVGSGTIDRTETFIGGEVNWVFKF